MSADGTKLAAVASDDYIYISNDSGDSWTTSTASSTATSTDLRNIAMSADGTKLAATAYNGSIYISVDSGATWTERPLTALRYWQDIAMSADGTKLAAVDNGYDIGGLIYTSDDSGESWYQQDDENDPGTRDWRGITMSADGTKLAAADYFNDSSGGYIYVYISNDSGATWTEHKVSSSTPDWMGVAASANGTRLAALASNRNLYFSNNSGATWTEHQASGALDWRGIAASADGNKLAAITGGATGYIYTSNDSGNTWTQRTAPGSHNWQGIAMSADGTKLAAADYGLVFGGYIYVSDSSIPSYTHSLYVDENNALHVSGLGSSVFDGKVGIGLIAPTTALEVAGTVSSTALQINGNATTTSLVVGTTTFNGFNYATGDMSVQNTLYANTVSSSNYFLNGSPMALVLAGTDGQTLYYSGSAWTPTSTLTIATSTGYVGIGTDNPQTALDINGTVSSTGLQVNGNSYFESSTTFNGNIGFNVHDGNINGIYERLTGVGNPRSALLFEHEITGDQSGAAYLGVGYDLIPNGYVSPLYKYTNQYFSPNIFQVNATGFHFLSEAATGTPNSTFTPTELLTVRNIGNLGGYLGIGNTAPVRPLSIVVNHGAGQIDMTENGTGTSDFAGLEMYNDLGHRMSLGITSENNTAHSPDNGYIATQGDLVFYTNNGYIEQMRILSNGNVGIGTDNPQTALEVNGTISSQTILPVADMAYDLGSSTL